MDAPSFETLVSHLRSLAELVAFVYLTVQTTKAKAEVAAQQNRFQAGNDAFASIRTDLQAMQIRQERVERSVEVLNARK